MGGKILENIIRDKLVNLIEENNIISDTQHDFRNKHSCLTNLLDIFQGIYDNWDSQVPSNVIYLDFQKAYIFCQKKVMTSNRGPFRLDNGEHVSNEVNMTGILNNYFGFGCVEASPAPANTIQLSNCELTEDYVRKDLENMKVNKTTGSDHIVLRVMKETKYQICKPLSIIFNK